MLVTGPTGSGKTNTLYSALSQINQPGVNIMTAEDPVEFNLPGINQVQVSEQIGLTFAAALRSFLRQDPNIILVGEIRDAETAGDRGQSRADGAPRAVHAAHQRRAEQREPARQHGHRAVPRGQLDQPGRRAAPGAQSLRHVQGARHRVRASALVDAGLPESELPQRQGR